MLFSTYTFFCFLGIVLATAGVLRNWTARKAFLLVASYAFYATWNWPFTILLVISTVVDYYIGHRLWRSGSPGRRKLMVLASLVVNLGILAAFKYSEFILMNVAGVAGLAGMAVTMPKFDIVLPLGISFYTFQSMSYSIDIYRRKYEPTRKLLDFALFVTFFPQLVAGPIVRADHFLPQCERPPEPVPNRWNVGLCLVLWGLFKKVAIADNMAGVVDLVYAAPGEAGVLGALAGTGAFAVQIFCDFSGYSQMAIGMALFLGFHLPDNFRHPYAAIGFSDFWRRWHISLSQWLRDYLYIALGGNRGSDGKTTRNLMLTMLLGGLWHGAAWNFVIWGGLHGLYLWGERVLLRLFGISKGYKPPKGLKGFMLAMLTFSLVLATWIFFRAQTFSDAITLLAQIGGAGGLRGNLPLRMSQIAMVGVALSALLVGGWIFRDVRLESAAARLPKPILAVALGLLLAFTYLVGGHSRAFIYFQF